MHLLLYVLYKFLMSLPLMTQLPHIPEGCAHAPTNQKHDNAAVGHEKYKRIRRHLPNLKPQELNGHLLHVAEHKKQGHQ